MCIKISSEAHLPIESISGPRLYLYLSSLISVIEARKVHNRHSYYFYCKRDRLENTNSHHVSHSYLCHHKTYRCNRHIPPRTKLNLER